MKRFLCVMFVVLLAFGMLGCAKKQAQSAGEKKLKVGLMLYSAVDEATITIRNGVIKAAEEYGVELTIGENGGDATKTAALLQSMFTQQVDAIIDVTWDDSVGVTTSQLCKEKGIPLVTCDVAYDDYAVLVGPNNYGSGRTNGEYSAKWIKDNWGGEIDLILGMYPYFTGPAIKARIDGCLDVFKEQGILPAESKIIWQDNIGATDQSRKITTDFLTANPNARKIFIITNNDAGALGAYNAVLAMNREKDCMIMSFNADSYALEHFATTADSAWKGTVNFNLAQYGSLAMPVIFKILESGRNSVENVYNTQTFVIDRANVKDYYKP